MLLSIVITTRNRYEDLISCLTSLKESNLANITYEIIIVDDASTDATKDLTISTFKGIKHFTVIHNEHQQMMVISRNTGGNIAKGKYILFIDDDNIIDEDMIAYLVTFAESNNSYGMLGPSMYLLKGKKRYLDYQKINFFTSKTTAYVDNTNSVICESDGIPNVFMVRNDAFTKCGGFDPKILQTYSEPELFFHMRTFGYKCGILKKAKTYHNVHLDSAYSPRNMGAAFPQKAFCLIRNRTIIIFRYGSLIHKISYLLLFSWVWPLVYSFIMLRYKKFSLIKLYWRGFFDGLYFVFTGTIREFKL